MAILTFMERARRSRFDVGTLRYSAVGLVTVITWLLVGELGMAMRDRAVMPASLEMLRRYGASDHLVSVLLSGIPAALALLMTPLIGGASDRYRSRWGRRRPFLFALAPVGGLALLGVAASQRLGAWSAALAGAGADPHSHALTVFAVCWTIFAGVMLCVQALYTGLVNDVLPREWLGRFFGLYRVVSLSIGIAFYLWLFPALDRHLFAIVGVIAVLYAGMIMLMCAMVREGAYPAPAPRAGASLTRARASFADAFTLPQAGWIFGALIVGGIAFGPFNTFSQYYAESLGVSKTELGELSSMAYGVSIVLALIIGSMVDRYGAVTMSLAIMALYTAGIGAGYLLLHDAGTFRPVYLLHVVLSGAYFTAAASLPMALLPRLDFLRFCAIKDLLGSFLGISLSLAQGAVLDRAGHDYRLTLLFAACAGMVATVCLGRLVHQAHAAPAPAIGKS